MKKVLLFIIVLISNLTLAQDGEEWHFKFKFKLNTRETLRYTFKNVEVLVNDSKNFQYLRNYDLNYNSKTKEYQLLIIYNCISCGYPNSDFPPEIYLRLEFEGNRLQHPFYSVIPIYFQKSESFKFEEYLNYQIYDELVLEKSDSSNSQDAQKKIRSVVFNNISYDNAIDLGTIEIQNFITDDHWKDAIEPCHIIEVRSRDSIQYKKAGDYNPRRMNRLMPLHYKK